MTGINQGLEEPSSSSRVVFEEQITFDTWKKANAIMYGNIFECTRFFIFYAIIFFELLSLLCYDLKINTKKVSLFEFVTLLSKPFKRDSKKKQTHNKKQKKWIHCSSCAVGLVCLTL